MSIALPAIRRSLGASLSQSVWVGNAYMLTLATLILVGGALGDRFGIARVFSVGIAIFVVTSLACAFSWSAEALIATPAAQGIGAAIMVPGSLAIISRTYPRDRRGRAIGIWAAASALTTAAGPIIGGLLLTIGGPEAWRWIFAVNLPFGALAIWLVLRSVDVDRTNAGRRLDILGAALAVIALGAIAYSLTGTDAGGLSRGAGIAGVAGLAVLALFLWQQKQSPNPMMPLIIFVSRTFSAANVVTFTLYFGLSAVLFFLPMLVIAGWGYSEIVAAAAFAPLTLFIAALSSRSGAIADRTGPGRPIALGCATVAVAYAWLAVGLGWRDFWLAVLPPMLLMGLGMALVVAPLSTAVMVAVDDDQTGIASGINNAVSRIAGLVAVALMSTVVAYVYVSAGGTSSYGIDSDAAGHVPAMNAAFAAVAITAAALSALSASVALFGIVGPAQTGS